MIPHFSNTHFTLPGNKKATDINASNNKVPHAIPTDKGKRSNKGLRTFENGAFNPKKL